MIEYFAEFLGTLVLILLGNGVVANVLLNRTGGHNGGWIVITFGWGIGVFVGVILSTKYSGAHLNPAVTIGLALAGLFEPVKVVPFIVAQFCGAITGSWMVYLFYRDHFRITSEPGVKKACFCTAPGIRNYPTNLLSEIIGTFVLIITILLFSKPELTIPGSGAAKVGLGSLEALPVALLVIGIGLSLGGTTGYAINPARDLGPRLVHALIPMKNKDDNDWKYSWIPVVGPITGAALAVLVFIFVNYLNN